MKRLLVLMWVVFLLVGCNNNDLQTYDEYQSELKSHITEYLTNNTSKEEFLVFLNEFEQFVDESSFDKEVVKQQKEVIDLYRKGIEDKDPSKITEAARLNAQILTVIRPE